MSIFGFRKTQMVSAEDALSGRSESMPVLAPHEVLHTPLQGPYPEGYEGGFTPNPSYEEVCTGKTGHTETVRVVFDPAKVSYQQLLKVSWESHDPTQGTRCCMPGPGRWRAGSRRRSSPRR